MKKVFSIALVSIYLLFNLGISFSIHHCQSGKVEVSLFSFSLINQNQESKSCCHHHPKQKHEWECENSFFLLDLSDEQLGVFNSKTFDKKLYPFLFPLVHSTNTVCELIKEAILIAPPPPNPAIQQIISQQQLLFYA